MSKFGKWLGGGLGWALGGPIGGLIGFALGAVLDDSGAAVQATNAKHHTQRGDFSASLIILVAAVMKADGRVMKAELEYVKAFFVKHFGVDVTKEQMLLLREILEKEIPLYDVCNQIRHNMEYASRLQLIHFLFGVSMADGQVHDSEVKVIEQIASFLNINMADFNSLKAMFYADTDSDYKILEVHNTASDEEIKKAYKRMAVKFHPDKVSHLGEEYQQDAKEKFQKVQQAYENIKKQRGIK
ncbi:MAG TPA: TerB family tellurite resistance protein [Bacteroidia bacterium]|nr:TerB family tellurite resistance protein [Bacteroidia bacterium]